MNKTIMSNKQDQVYLAVVSDGKRNSFPMAARTVEGILKQVNNLSQFPFASKVTKLQSNVSFYYGADMLLGMIDGEWEQIGMLINKESIPD